MRSIRRIATLPSVAALLLGCTSDRASYISGPTGNGGANNESNGVAGSTSGATSNPDDGINVDLDAGFDESCLTDEHEADPVTVDLFIMLDRSGSMLDPTTRGTAKWDDITSALVSFAADTSTKDMGIGLQYFPLTKPGVPLECNQDSECGSNGPCIFGGTCESIKLLAGSNCLSVRNCPSPQDECLPVGACAVDGRYCAPAGSICRDGLGACLSFPGICNLQDDCNPAVYGQPEIPIVGSTDRGTIFADSISNTFPQGNTPTALALQGAIDYAQSWKTDHPDHVVAVVLATDGIPSECSPIDALVAAPIDPIADIARSAVQGASSIRTFVIGIFSALDTSAPENLNTIAEAGGTDSAHIVSTDGDVPTDFYTALDSIRVSTPACDFKLASDTSGSLVNYDLVNLQFTNDSGDKTSLYNVKTKAGCAENDDQGWYYVTELGSEKPSQISVCPGVCEDFTSSKNGRIELKIGCKTLVR